ncbi:hypothetical protein ACP0HM_02060 [Escherichia coli]
MLGFKDGTANPDSQNDKLMQKVVWVTADQQEPAWTIGGSYQAVRLIQFRVEFLGQNAAERTADDFWP